MQINHDRLQRDLAELARFGATPAGGVSRASFSAADRGARAWLLAQCDAIGLEVRRDGLGNLFCRLPRGSGAPVGTGSHIDSVPDGGRFDGALGVLASLECVRRLVEEDVALARPVELVVFADEEGCYHSLLGSHGLATGYERPELEALRGRDGDLLADALAGMGWDGWDLEQAATTRLEPGAWAAFVELHIEQGRTLETAEQDLGVVTGIVGLGHGALTFRGQSDHAGTTAMAHRRDALVGAAALVTALPDLAAAVDPGAVATCGRLDVRPGSTNVVPASAEVALDFRHAERAVVETLEEAIVGRAQEIGAAQGLEVSYARESLIDPVPMADEVADVIAAVAEAQGLAWRRMPSGAGHDAQRVASLAPTAMLFVPSRDGRSHTELEHTDPAHVTAGANVLLETLRRLAC